MTSVISMSSLSWFIHVNLVILDETFRSLLGPLMSILLLNHRLRLLQNKLLQSVSLGADGSTIHAVLFRAVTEDLGSHFGHISTGYYIERRRELGGTWHERAMLMGDKCWRRYGAHGEGDSADLRVEFCCFG
jgi:hypothetical protein